MVTIESSMYVPRMRSRSVIEFMLNATDERYRAWWPGTHFAMHAFNGAPGVGQVVYMDELVGDRRIRMRGVVTDAGPNRITWQLKRLVRLPCWLRIVVDDDINGATITHTIRAGYRHPMGRLLDPLFRLYFSDRFARMMEEHFTIEFSRLPDVLEADSASQAHQREGRKDARE